MVELLFINIFYKFINISSSSQNCCGINFAGNIFGNRWMHTLWENILNQQLIRISNRNLADVSGEEMRNVVNVWRGQETDENNKIPRIAIILNHRKPGFIASTPEVCWNIFVSNLQFVSLELLPVFDIVWLAILTR